MIFSTRSIISALLRKSGYRVVSVPDGLKAWELLKGKSHTIDLVLAEVELPSICGFSLLSMIMEDETFRNIPVIMMSPHDAVNIVFKCMLRGAADFLVKPVRKNELRNLWQHVWRRKSVSSTGLTPLDRTLSQQNEAIDESSSTKDSSSHCVASSKENSEKESDAHIRPNLGSVRKFPNQEKYAGLIADAGFQKVQYENLVGGVVAIHSGLKI